MTLTVGSKLGAVTCVAVWPSIGSYPSPSRIRTTFFESTAGLRRKPEAAERKFDLARMTHYAFVLRASIRLTASL